MIDDAGPAVRGRRILPVLPDDAPDSRTDDTRVEHAGGPAGFWRSALDRLALWARTSSPWILHVNSGSCNGCDIELLATLTPRYDLERLGVRLQGSPRHADVLVCTGPVTRQSRERLRRLYDQMPDPKFVVAVGACATSEGVFCDCYGVAGPVDQVIPVDVYVPGCPPRPEAIVDGVVQLLEKLRHPKTAEPPAPSPSPAPTSPDQEAQS